MSGSMGLSDRAVAVWVGVLYIIGTVAGASSLLVTSGILEAPDYLSTVASHAGRAQLAALLVLVMGVALAAIPAVIFPILRRLNQVLAVGYVIFRGALETLTYIGAALRWLFLVVVARQYASAGAAAASQFSSLGAVVVKAQDPITAIQDIVFSIGGLMFYYVLYRARLIPRWLTLWGIVGLVAYLTAGVIALFGPHLVPLLLPLALQEMVMAVWLIARGFDPSALADLEEKFT